MELQKPKRKAEVASVIFFFAFIGATYLSGSLPFIPSEEYLSFLTYIAFPTLCAFFIYGLFFNKNKATGLSSYITELNKRHTLVKKFIYRFLAAVGIPFLPALILSLIQWYPAWPSQYLCSEQTSFEAVIVKFGDLPEPSA